MVSFAKNKLKMSEQNELKLINWIEFLQARGIYSFSIQLAKDELSAYSETALKRALSRLSQKGKIISIYKGYYLILPPQYAIKGILPPVLFLDAFFKFLERPYYVSLLNAAAFHGAAHQQPQEYFVMTDFPAMRPTQKSGLKINYISIKNFDESLVEKRKTEAGFMNISKPVLTATDIIQFEKRIGGLNRAATVISELAEAIKPEDVNTNLLNHVSITILQRLGYILEFICDEAILADALFHVLNNQNLLRIPLKASTKKVGFSSKNRWNIIVNSNIEID